MHSLEGMYVYSPSPENFSSDRFLIETISSLTSLV